ncbi:MAG: TetR/AcrR family transcriptional regulator [Acidimicrobiia bacterium]
MGESGSAALSYRLAGRDAQRQLILDAASRVLESEGPDALTMRRLASEVGASTSVLYTMFGGKNGVAEALWLEGFARLQAALDAVDDEDPLGRLAAMGQAYRANALTNHAYYSVMLARPIPGFQPSDAAYAKSLRPLQTLSDAVADCIDAGVLREADAGHVARVLWAAAHGAVSLELAGYEGAIDPEECFNDLVAAAAAWFFPSPRPARRTRRASKRDVGSRTR